MDNEQDKGIAYVADNAPELIMLPKGSQILPSYFDTLWQIAQEVAERDSTYGTDVGFDDVPETYCCPFLGCDGELTRLDHNRGNTFPHSADCIVTKARELMERRKQQHTPTVTILPSVEMNRKQIIECFNISSQKLGTTVVDADENGD